jgi:hypothetical protein
MPGPRFNTDDKPVFNDFGKPIIQPYPETGEGPRCSCCAKCEQYLQCFKEVPFAVDLAGLDFSGWIEWALLVWAQDDGIRVRQGDFTGSDPDGSSEFIGKFVFLPRDSRASNNGQSCFLEEGESREYCRTHHSPYYRTIHTPGNPDALNKKVSLFANVICCHEDDDPEMPSIGVKFQVMLQVEGESGSWNWGFWGGEPYEWWWHNDNAFEYAFECCPILETDCILWEDIDPLGDWSNLQNLPLHRAQDFYWYDPLELIEDPTAIGCQFFNWGWFGGGQSICAEFDGEDCVLCDEGDPLNECPNGTVDIGLIDYSCDGVEVSVPRCVPDPIRLIDPGENYLSVLGNCRPKDCVNCEPPAEWEGPKPPARTVVIHFTTDGGCGKTFTAVYPDCLEVEEENIFWSFGKTGPTAYHYLNNLLSQETTEYGEIVTLTIVDNRGCVYEYCQMVTCECCSGASGTLSVTPSGPCSYTLSASVTDSETGACDGHSAFIEYQLSGETCPAFPYDGQYPCNDLTDNDCIHTIGDGQSTEITVDGEETLRWRVWDRLCGCAGPWHEEDLICSECECCSTPLTGVTVTISGISQGDIEGCLDCDDKINGTYFVPMSGCSGSADFEDHFECEDCDPLPCDYVVTINVAITCFPGAGPGGQDLVQVDVVFSTPPLGEIVFHKDVLFPPDSLPIDCAEELDGSIENLYFGGDPWLFQCSGSAAAMTLDFVG